MGDSMDGFSSANALLMSLWHQLKVAFVGGKCSVLVKQNYTCYVLQNNCWYELITDATGKKRKVPLREDLLGVKAQQ